MSKIVQELLSLGYTEHKGNRVHHKGASRWFQKRVRGEYGTKYFINAALYDCSMLRSGTRTYTRGSPTRVLCAVHKRR